MTLGLAFTHKIVAAGLSSKCSWSSDGEVLYTDEATDADKAAVAALVSAHDPAEDVTAEAWASLREVRNRLLAACDWTQMADSPLAGTSKTAWATYRQALRNLPADTADPATPVWPEPPE